MNKQQTVDYLERFVKSDYFLGFVNKTEKLFTFGEYKWDYDFLNNNFIFYQFIIHSSDALDKLVEITNFQNISPETPFETLFENSKKELGKISGGKNKDMLTILNLTYKLEEYNPDLIIYLKNEYPALNKLANDGRSMFYLMEDFLIYSVGHVIETIEKLNKMYHSTFDGYIQSNLSLPHYLIFNHPFLNDEDFISPYKDKLNNKFIFDAVNDVFRNTDNDLFSYQNLYPEKNVNFNIVNWNKFRNRFLDNLKILEKAFTINNLNGQIEFYNTNSNLLDNQEYFEQHKKVSPEINKLTNLFKNYKNHKIMSKDLIGKLSSKFDFQSIETKLEKFYLNGVKLIESELKKCEDISELGNEEIDWSTDMPFEYDGEMEYLIMTVESHLDESYYNLFSKS